MKRTVTIFYFKISVNPFHLYHPSPIDSNKKGREPGDPLPMVQMSLIFDNYTNQTVDFLI